MGTQPKQERPARTGPAVAGRIKSPGSVTTPSKPSVSVCDDLQVLIAKRAHALYMERGCRHGHAIDDWLEAEREVLSQIPPV